MRQEITASTMSREEADLLAVPRNSPGLEIVRHYIGKSGRLLEVARSMHPSKSFKYSMHVELQSGAEARKDA